MAASGQSVAMPTAAMSGSTAAPAAGPMQADKATRKYDKYTNRERSAMNAATSIRLGAHAGNRDDEEIRAAKFDKIAERAKAKRAKWAKRMKNPYALR